MRLLFVLVVLLGMSGCFRRVGCVQPIDESGAVNLVLSLPEVAERAKDINQLSRGSVHLFAMPDGAATPVLDGKTSRIWLVYVGEDHDDHVVRLMTYGVDTFNGMIYRLDGVFYDQYTPIANVSDLAPNYRMHRSGGRTYWDDVAFSSAR